MKTTKLSIFNRGGALLTALTAYHVFMAVIVMTLVTGATSLIGSNMGFKATRDYTLNSDPAALNRFGIALPHNNPWMVVDATPDSDAFLADLCVGHEGVLTLALIKYDNAGATDVAQSMTSCSALGGVSFDFAEGESYQLEVQGGDLTGAVLVGSQDPSFPPGGTKFLFNSNPAAKNRFGVSITPNTKWATANDLLTAWCAGQEGTNTLALIKYDNAGATDVAQSMTSCSAFGGTDFPLVPFEGYQLEIAADSPRTQEPYY